MRAFSRPGMSLRQLGPFEGSTGLIKYHRSHGLVPRDVEYLSWWRPAAGRAEKGYASDFGSNTIECNTLGGIGTAASASPANGIPDTELRVEFS